MVQEHGHDDRAWTAPVWFDVLTAAPPPPAPENTGPVASRRSEVYDPSLQCRDAQAIKQGNRVFGNDAVKAKESRQNYLAILGAIVIQSRHET